MTDCELRALVYEMTRRIGIMTIAELRALEGLERPGPHGIRLRARALTVAEMMSA